MVDLADNIAKIVGFKYKIVPTNGYGSLGKDGRWDGMIRELLEEVIPSLRNIDLVIDSPSESAAFPNCASNAILLFDIFDLLQRADLAMGDLTINYDREQVS